MTNEKIIHTVATVHNSVEKFVLYQKHNRTYVHTEKKLITYRENLVLICNIYFAKELGTFWYQIDQRC